jgi:hypothetical protein
MFAAGIEIKTPTMHVEAASDVFTGLGFKSPRLHSTAEYGLANDRPRFGPVECPERTYSGRFAYTTKVAVRFGGVSKAGRFSVQ